MDQAQKDQESGLVHLMKFLPFSTLKTSRLVSRRWDKTAVRQLSKKMIIQIQSPKEECIFRNICRVRDLEATLENSLYAHLLFQNIRTITTIHLPFQIMGSLFGKFGNYVTSLGFYDEKPWHSQLCGNDERQMLLHNYVTSFCPNLVTLELQVEPWVWVTSTPGPCASKKFGGVNLLVNKNTNLEEVIIKDRQIVSLATRDWILSLITSSPNLKLLKMNLTEQGAKDFYEYLGQFPSIVENLEEFHCSLFEDEAERLEKLAEEELFLKDELNMDHDGLRGTAFNEFFKYFKKLRKLSIRGSRGILYSQTKEGEGEEGEIGRFQDKVAKELPDGDFVNVEARFDLMSLELININGTVRNTDVDGNDAEVAAFIQLFPNLSELKVIREDVDGKKHDCDLVMIGLDLLKDTPFQNLTKLTLKDCLCDLDDHDAALNFAIAFPNLEFLHLEIVTGWNEGRPEPCDLLQVIPVLDSLQKLKVFKINACVEELTDLMEVLLYLPGFKSLESLTILGWTAFEEYYRKLANFLDEIGELRPTLTFEMLKEALLSLRNHLKSIQFHKSIISYEDWENVMMFAAANNIPLELID